MRKILVAYFSASGTTAGAARSIAQAVGGDLYEIRPATPYTRADLDWTDKKSRSSLEMNDPACRPAIAQPVEDMDQYDTIFLGFPSGGTWSPGSWTPSWRAMTLRQDHSPLRHLRGQRHRRGRPEHAGPLPRRPLGPGADRPRQCRRLGQGRPGQGLSPFPPP